MGFGPFSSDSKSTLKRQDIAGNVTATSGPAQSTNLSGKGTKSVSQGGLNLERGANIGGYTLGNIAKGATVNLTTTSTGADTSGLDHAADALDQAIKFQADSTAAALGSVGHIGEDRSATDSSSSSTPVIALASAAVVAVALIALAIILRK